MMTPFSGMLILTFQTGNASPPDLITCQHTFSVDQHRLPVAFAGMTLKLTEEKPCNYKACWRNSEGGPPFSQMHPSDFRDMNGNQVSPPKKFSSFKNFKKKFMPGKNKPSKQKSPLPDPSTNTASPTASSLGRASSLADHFQNDTGKLI